MSIIKLDLHIHTIYSKDSKIKPSEIVQFARKKGLNGFAICDHDTLKGYEIVKKKIAKFNDLIVIPGMEVETDMGEIIGLFIDSKIDLNDNDFFIIVQKVKEVNGMVIIPHPFDFLRRNRLKLNLLSKRTINKYIDGIEVFNSRIIFKYCINKAKKFMENHNLSETGGSDAHTTKEIGNGFTIFPKLSELSQESIRNALISKKSISKGRLSNPIVHLFTIYNKIKQRMYF